jgi:hypothetical protein
MCVCVCVCVYVCVCVCVHVCVCVCVSMQTQQTYVRGKRGRVLVSYKRTSCRNGSLCQRDHHTHTLLSVCARCSPPPRALCVLGVADHGGSHVDELPLGKEGHQVRTPVRPQRRRRPHRSRPH